MSVELRRIKVVIMLKVFIVGMFLLHSFFSQSNNENKWNFDLACLSGAEGEVKFIKGFESKEKNDVIELDISIYAGTCINGKWEYYFFDDDLFVTNNNANDMIGNFLKGFFIIPLILDQYFSPDLEISEIKNNKIVINVKFSKEKILNDIRRVNNTIRYDISVGDYGKAINMEVVIHVNNEEIENIILI